MPVSLLYKNLRKRLSVLKKQFLDFNSDNSPSSQNQDKLRAFKLLAHAEIESYIEDAALDIWKGCKSEWTNNKRFLPSLVFLIMYSSSKFEANEHQLIVDERIEQILNTYQNVVSKNNGIMRKNILQLFMPLGIKYADIDSTWLSTINSYGSSRGNVAHTSFAVQQQLDMKDELNNLDLVLKGIKKLDLRLQTLSTNLRKPFC